MSFEKIFLLNIFFREFEEEIILILSALMIIILAAVL